MKPREEVQRAAALHLLHRSKHGVRHVGRILGVPKSTVSDWARRGAAGIKHPVLRQIALDAIQNDEPDPAVAASEAWSQVQALLAEPAPPDANTGVMVALFVPPDIAEQLAIDAQAEPTATPASELHLTLAYLGRLESDVPAEQIPRLCRLVAGFASIAPCMPLEVSGVGRFSDGDRVVYASVDAPQLPAFRQRLVEYLRLGGFSPSTAHGFTPHVTLASPSGPALLDVDPASWVADMITVSAGGQRFDYPLEGTQMMFAGAVVRDTPRPKQPVGDPRELAAGDDDTAGGAKEDEESEGDFRAPGEPGPQDPQNDEPVGTNNTPNPKHSLVNLNRVAAIQRYFSLVANDVPHRFALTAARYIDPDFEPTDEHVARLYQALGKGGHDNPVRLGDRRLPALPSGAQEVYDLYCWDSETEQDLAAALSGVAQDAYLAGVNYHLAEFGEPPEAKVTDPQVLAALTDEVQAVATKVVSTFNADLAEEVYTLAVAQAGEETQGSAELWLQKAVERWGQDRAARKSEMIATTEASRWRNQATDDFSARNEPLGLAAESVQVTADECSCPACAALAEGSPYTAQEAASISLPLHPWCSHLKLPAWSPASTADPSQLWRATST